MSDEGDDHDEGWAWRQSLPSPSLSPLPRPRAVDWQPPNIAETIREHWPKGDDAEDPA